MIMLHRSLVGAIAVVAAWGVAMSDARSQQEAKYPDWNGQWIKSDRGNAWDPTKPGGRAQQAPLTPAYQAIYEANLADQAVGGQGTDPLFRCVPPGMPRQMTAVFPMEIMIMPSTTYMAFEQGNVLRRIYTDGRPWPQEREPSFAGYSIGKWVDENGDGRYDALEVETRGMKGPRAYEPSGIPLHSDNQTVIKERFYPDKASRDIMHLDITTIDNALTRPWTVTKNFRRSTDTIWYENICTEGNNHVVIAKENYFLSADGLLMPAKKDQPPPDLRYFNQSRK
jgi:hypothetical protein